MLATPNNQHAFTSSPSSNSRRVPAQNSVSLRRLDRSTGTGSSIQRPLWEGREEQYAVPLLSSAASNDTGDSGDISAEKWFNRSNKRPGAGLQPTFDDGKILSIFTHTSSNINPGEPPFLLPHNTTTTYSASVSNGIGIHNMDGRAPAPIVMRSTNGSSVDDYRSVIDDLTIENKKLREKLRRYEAQYNSDLEQDRLFELKIHRDIPSRKKRELEETLQAFVSTVDGSPERKRPRVAEHTTPTPETPSLQTARQQQQPNTQKPSSSSTSNSRPVDSAYASMSAYGPTSTSVSHRLGSGVRPVDVNMAQAKDQKVQHFLQDMTEGLLSKQPQVMTERQRKKMVVKRLEQLFTGKVIGTIGDHNQPMQQQEISRAATAEQSANQRWNLTEGNREAQIHAVQSDVDGAPRLESQESTESGNTNSDRTSRASPAQRPTRPLDLDPDRAQNPSDNVKYIRHLGLSTPHLVTHDSRDADADDANKGWTHLNLLYNMAQLHMINVTLDFVRSAVADVSAKLQLSPDGREIRWRGGSEGTRLSSDSDSRGKDQSPDDSDSYEESHAKRKKTGGATVRIRSPEQTGAPQGQTKPITVQANTQTFHYRPLFRHRNSDDGSTSSDSNTSMSHIPRSAAGQSFQANPRESNSRCASSSKQRRNGGPIVFYTGAKFCTDLSGDRGDISTPHHVTSVGRDGFSNHIQNIQEVLGCSVPKTHASLHRTASGSSLPYRPLEDHSRMYDLLERESPKVLRRDSADIDLFASEERPMPLPEASLQQFNACGLGGTQPADHFAFTVTTRISRADDGIYKKLARSPTLKPSLWKYKHSIPKQSLDIFRRIEQDNITMKLASLNTHSSPPPAPQMAHEYLPVKNDIISTVCQRLAPTDLPGATAYYDDDSSSEEGDLDSDDSYGGISHLRDGPTFFHAFENPVSRVTSTETSPSAMDIDGSAEYGEEAEEDESSGMSEDDDESIDMLVHARQADPQLLAAQEMEFEEDVNRRLLEALPAEGSAATVDGTSSNSADTLSSW
jgi:hypothetical protein